MYNQEYHKQYYLKHRGEKQRKYYESKKKCSFCGKPITNDAKQCSKCFLLRNNPSKKPGVRIKISESKKGPKNYAWKGGKIQVRCSYCQKIVKRWKSEIKHSKKGLLFCNRNCKARYEAISKLGPNGPVYKHGGYSQIAFCKTCGREFRRKRTEKRKYCSQKCRPNVGYRYIQGRRYEYKAIGELKKRGFQIVIRSARSQGIFDVFAIKGNKKTREIDEVRCIQVKATTSTLPIRSIVPKKERGYISRNKQVPIAGRNIFYEIWVWRLRKWWDIYRLNWKTKEFEKLSG